MSIKSLKHFLYDIVQNNSKEQWVNVDTWLTSLNQLVRSGAPILAPQEVAASIGIKVTSDYKALLIRIKSITAGPITLTANPQMSIGGIDGQRVILEGIDATATVEVIDGNGFKLAGSANFTLALNDVLVLMYNQNQNLWIEISRSKNT